jgi:hypothetical protein
MGLAEDSFMSEAHLPTEELAQAAAYESGRAAGLAAIAEMFQSDPRVCTAGEPESELRNLAFHDVQKIAEENGNVLFKD